jgi:acyl-CoA synthetase (NDP forming)
MLRPRGIAIVGATEDPSRIGGRVLANLLLGFKGPLYPVSLTRSRVQGLPARRRLGDIEGEPDLAVLAVAGGQVAEVMGEATARGVAGVIVLSGGFAETGAEGANQQRALVETAAAAGTRILGPNTIGFIDPRRGVYATFLHNAVGQGPLAPVALITQSGAIGAYLLRTLRWVGLGLNLMCATGNEADVTTTELIEHVLEDPEITIILVCVEGTRDVARLVAAGRLARARGKAILLLKIGVSGAGQRAAKSHSGAVSSDAEAFSAALRHAGIVEVDTMAALARYGTLFQSYRRAKGNRLGILTTSGGTGIHLTDRAARLGIQVPPFSDEEQKRISASLPSFASAINPVDVTGNVINDPGSLRDASTAMMQTSAIDIGLINATNVGTENEETAFAAIVEAFRQSDKPLIALAHDAQSAQSLMERGIFAVDDPELAIGAAKALVSSAAMDDHPPRQPLSDLDPAVIEARRLMGAAPALEPDVAFQVLNAFGVPAAKHAVAYSVEEAVECFERFDGPVAVKLAISQVAHKSDIGGVILALRDPDGVAEATARLLSLAEERGLPKRVLVQRMSPSGIELFCGMYRAEEIGAALVVGLGGVLVEILADTQTVLAVESDQQFRAALERLCGGRLAGHARGLSASALERLEKIMARVAMLALSLPEIEQLDLNPLIVSGDEVTLVDAVCIIAAARPLDPGH